MKRKTTEWEMVFVMHIPQNTDIYTIERIPISKKGKRPDRKIGKN